MMIGSRRRRSPPVLTQDEMSFVRRQARTAAGLGALWVCIALAVILLLSAWATGK
jgi:hypothetical protein